MLSLDSRAFFSFFSWPGLLCAPLLLYMGSDNARDWPILGRSLRTEGDSTPREIWASKRVAGCTEKIFCNNLFFSELLFWRLLRFSRGSWCFTLCWHSGGTNLFCGVWTERMDCAIMKSLILFGIASLIFVHACSYRGWAAVDFWKLLHIEDKESHIKYITNLKQFSIPFPLAIVEFFLQPPFHLPQISSVILNREILWILLRFSQVNL